MKTLFTILFCAISALSFSKNKLWTCINEDGSTAFELEAKYVYDFSDGLARVKVSSVVNNQWVSKIGFVGKDGKMAIEPKYEKVKGSGFKNGRAWVKTDKESNWKLIDKAGKEIPTNGYSKVGYIHENNYDLLAVYKDDMLGFVDYSGKEVIPCKYLGGTTFPQGLACVTLYVGTDEKYGFISPTGEVMIPFQYKQAGIATFMDNGYCRATVAGRTVLIDTKGNVVFKTSKGNIQGMSNNWVRVFTKSGRSGWGFLNFNDEWMIDPIYGDLDDFNENGMAIAEKDGLSGIIDTSNNVILPFKYKTVYFAPGEDGYVMGVYPTDEPQSLMNTPKDYFTPDFKPVDLTGIKHIHGANGGKLMPYTDGAKLKGYLDREFKVVIKAKYKKAESFSEGLAWVLMP